MRYNYIIVCFDESEMNPEMELTYGRPENNDGRLDKEIRVYDFLDSLGIDAYEWSDNPTVKNKIKNIAAVEYNAGGSDKAIKTIDGMDSEQLRNWLKQLAKKDIDLGVKIIINGGE